MLKLDKNTTAVILAALTLAGGWVDQRAAVARIEAKVDVLAKDVAELQHERYARTDDE